MAGDATMQGLGKLVPGFDFLENLVKGAGAAMPGIGQWIAPTLDPEELGKRIEELRTVQYWLEQNARMVGTTVQALEVQRMTLTTLQTMNLKMADLSESLRVKVPEPAQDESAAAPKGGGTQTSAQAASSTSAVDPMQWWGALTQQFTQLAAQAMKDASTDSAKTLASDLVTQSLQAADAGLRQNVAAMRDSTPQPAQKRPRRPAGARPAGDRTPKK